MNKYKKIKLRNGKTIDEHRLLLKVVGYNNVVHHKDGNTMNNEIHNLEIMTRSEHCKLHGFGKLIRPSNMFAPDVNGNAKCRMCGKVKPWDEFMTDNEWSHGKSSRCKKCFNEKRKAKRHSVS